MLKANSRGTIRLGYTQTDQMVLRIVWLAAGPLERRPKMPNGELKNNSRKPRGLVRKLA